MNPDFEIIDLSFADKTFYGFRLDPDTGKATVERINDGSPVSLPLEDLIRKEDYRNWFWTKHTVQFTWGLDKNTHMLMEIL
jgi:hypothetical protein